MHDIRAIRDNPAAFDAALARRGLSPVTPAILALDEERRARITAAEQATAEQNRASREVGAAKARGDDAEFERLRALVAEKKAEVARLTEEAKAKDRELEEMLLVIPNLPYPDVPEGADEAQNVEIRRWGNPRNFSFPALEHYQIPAAKGGMDFETAAKLSGSRFVVLSGAMARLQRRACAVHAGPAHRGTRAERDLDAGAREARDDVGTGQLPKFAEDSFETTNGWWLVPTPR
jgi:seryl-tRNA synthetase